MKIGFILSNCVISPSNGIVSQALTWKGGLERLGCKVVLIDMWQKNDWRSFDILHFFGFSIYMRDFIIAVSRINSNIVVSPILDPNYNINKLKLYSRWGNNKLNLTNQYHGLHSIKDKIKMILVRSEFENEYMIKGFGFKPSICNIVPISCNIPIQQLIEKKDSFCLHVSLLTDERKNVKRLIQAAIKYKFKLILGGKLRNDLEIKKLNAWIGDNENIEYHGYLSHEQLINLYSRARVFALPSTNEGVGIVALEAASLGCDVVITKFGGSKEYYNQLAKFIDPYDIDDIGKAVVAFLKGDTFQPFLSEHVKAKFSSENNTRQLLNVYNLII
jgi:glycosyltransferase involved in cell wall biosynthesis